MNWPIYKNSHYILHVKIPSHKARMLFYFIYFNFSAPNSQFPCGLVVRIPRSHRGGRGSIPRMGRFLSITSCLNGIVGINSFYDFGKTFSLLSAFLTVNQHSSFSNFNKNTCNTLLWGLLFFLLLLLLIFSV